MYHPSIVPFHGASGRTPRAFLRPDGTRPSRRQAPPVYSPPGALMPVRPPLSAPFSCAFCNISVFHYEPSHPKNQELFSGHIFHIMRDLQQFLRILLIYPKIHRLDLSPSHPPWRLSQIFVDFLYFFVRSVCLPSFLPDLGKNVLPLPPPLFRPCYFRSPVLEFRMIFYGSPAAPFSGSAPAAGPSVPYR